MESKFTEPYRSSLSKNHLKEKYFSKRHWAEVGLPACQEVAERLRTQDLSFQFLDAAQLLKHMLGLAIHGGEWQLLYLWFDTGDDSAQAHTAELATFSGVLKDDHGRFHALSYQALWASLSNALGIEHQAYVTYLSDRYFGAR
jgi:hypothetical protein